MYDYDYKVTVNVALTVFVHSHITYKSLGQTKSTSQATSVEAVKCHAELREKLGDDAVKLERPTKASTALSETEIELADGNFYSHSKWDSEGSTSFCIKMLESEKEVI